MASVPVANLSQEQKDELLCVYAALILHDDDAEISASNMNKLIQAAGSKVEPYWPALFARLVEGKNVADMLSAAGSPGAGGAAPAAGGGGDAAPAAGGGDSKAAAAAEEEEEEEEEMA